MTLNDMIRIKEERGLSFRQLSQYSGVPVVTLQKIFSGVTKKPRQATLDAIEKVLSGDERQYAGKALLYSQQSEVPGDRSAYTASANPQNTESGYSASANLSNADDSYPAATGSVEETPGSYYAEGGTGFRKFPEGDLTDGSSALKFGKKQGEYTIDDYRALPDDQRYELIDGVLIKMNSPRTVHQDITFIIHMQLYNYIRSAKKPCRVFESPMDVQISCDMKTMVQPDVLVVCKKDRIRGFGIYGAPDFILEVLSPSTRKKDMTIKLNKYLEAGVREYWIIDPDKKVLITYDFTDPEFLPCLHPLKGSVPLAISGGELLIDLDEIAESIEEFGSLE